MPQHCPKPLFTVRMAEGIVHGRTSFWSPWYRRLDRSLGRPSCRAQRRGNVATFVRALALVAAFVALQSSTAHAQAVGPIDARVTSDNAYGFGYGGPNSIDGPSAYLGKLENCDPQDIFSCASGPEKYSIPATAVAGATHLYLIAWADRGSTQGIIGQFTDTSTGVTLRTGEGKWEVYRTNQPYIACDATDPGGPPIVGINTQIDTATKGGLWMPVVEVADTKYDNGVFGEPNNGPQDTFPLVCDDSGAPNSIGSTARWMWYDATRPMSGATVNPFVYRDNPIDGYLIFRLALNQFDPCMSLRTREVVCEPGPYGPSGCYRVKFRLTNDANITANYVGVHPNDGGTVSPGVIELLNPITKGQQANREFVWCPPPGYAGGMPSFSLTLMDEQGGGCCASRLTIDLPDCPPISDCFQIPEATATCVPGAAPGTFKLSLLISKGAGARTLHLLAPAPMKISPQPHYLGPVAGTFGPVKYTIEGAPGNSYPRRVCFWVNLTPPVSSDDPYDLTGDCCSEYVCVLVPYCGLPTPTANPNPLSADSTARGLGDGS